MKRLECPNCEDDSQIETQTSSEDDDILHSCHTCLYAWWGLKCRINEPDQIVKRRSFKFFRQRFCAVCTTRVSSYVISGGFFYCMNCAEKRFKPKLHIVDVEYDTC